MSSDDPTNGAILIDESFNACYAKGREIDEDGKLVGKYHSTWRHNEVAQRWMKDGQIGITVRPMTKEEIEKRLSEKKLSKSDLT